MPKTVEQSYLNFRRIIATPYWCGDDPLRWHLPEHGVGIDHFAMNGLVGHFNLAWWLLACPSPPTRLAQYTDAPIGWVIQRAPFVRLTPQYSFTEAASFLTLGEWRQVMTQLDWSKYPNVNGHGVTSEMLRKLTITGER